MTPAEPLEVLGVGLFSPEGAPVRAWQRGGGSGVGHHPLATSTGAASNPAGRAGDASLLSARMRGRASLLTRIFADVIAQAAREAGADLRCLPIIYGSAFGEMATTQRLLDSLHGGDGRLSPAQFQSSVHNTAAGQLSISLGNPVFTTSLAAGQDTFAMCLLEAWSWLALHGGHVLVACADEPVPAVYQASADHTALGVALVLGSSQGRQAALARLNRPEARRLEHPAGALDAASQRGINPCAPALVLLDALFARQPSRVCLNPAAEWGWCVDVQPVHSGDAPPRHAWRVGEAPGGAA